MGVYDNPRDDAASVLARMRQEDPWVQHLIVCSEAARPLAETLGAVVCAVLDAAARFPDDPRYADDWAAWCDRSFRKVTLRARGAAWQRCLAFDAGVGRVGGEVKALALPPVLRSRRDPFLAKLQAWSAERDALPPDTAPWPAGVAMAFVLNADAPMRGGMAAAQVAHAALLLWESYGARMPEAFAAWRAGGSACVFVEAGAGPWAALKAGTHCAVIRDAGLTEVAPGTETVLAIVPGDTAVVRGLARV